jgi:WD40 repeat protein
MKTSPANVAFLDEKDEIVALDSARGLSIYDTKTGREELWPVGDPIPGGSTSFHFKKVAFSADARRLAALVEYRPRKELDNDFEPIFDGPLMVWDISRKRSQTFDVRKTVGISRGPLALSPDGRSILISGLQDLRRGVTLLRFDDCAVIGALQIGHVEDTYMHFISFSPDGKHAVTAAETGMSKGSEVFVRIWDVKSGRQLQAIKAPAGPVRAAAFLPNDELRLVSGGRDTLAVENGMVVGADPLKVWTMKMP